MYGKVMSLPDALMPTYFELCTELPEEEVRTLIEGLQQGTVHPRDAKRRLAWEIVRLWHGEEAARNAEEAFDRVFARRELPEEILEVDLWDTELVEGRLPIAHLVVRAGLAQSRSEARRLVRQGGVRLDGTRLEDPEARVEIRDGMVLRVGKRRFARIRLRR
jgi:tyrosyl-tRNA synthetase